MKAETMIDHTTCVFDHIIWLTTTSATVSNSNPLVTLFLLAFVLYGLLWRWRRRRYLRLAAALPGPPTYPLVGNAFMFATRPDEPLQICSELTERYKRSPFRVWIFFEFSVVVTKPEDVEVVLNTKLFRKSVQYDNMRSLMGEGIFTSGNQVQWRHSRKLMTPAFHFTILKGFLGVFFEEATILANKIEHHYNGESVNTLPLIGLCTLDTICRTAMGVSVNAQNGGGGDFVRDLETVLQIWQNRMAKQWLSIPFIFALTAMKKVHDKAADKVLGFTDEVIQKKRSRHKEKCNSMSKTFEDTDVTDKQCKMAFLDLMLESDMSDIQLRDETITIIIGGQETTSTELSFAVLMLALHPKVQEKVQEELDMVFGEDMRSAPSMSELNSLEYLERVIKETMRLFPALPAIGRRLQEDINVGSYLLPSGVDVGVFIYETHRDPSTWEDPNKFNPDNFLPEKCRGRNPYSYLPFSAGLRNCIGQKYAILQMKTVLSTLLRRFSLTPGPGHRTIDDVEVVMNTTLKSRKGFNVIFQLRNNNSQEAVVS